MRSIHGSSVEDDGSGLEGRVGPKEKGVSSIQRSPPSFGQVAGGSLVFCFRSLLTKAGPKRKLCHVELR